MVGDVLYPLNELAQDFPDIYAQYTEKYKGRESLMEKTIPLLNCLWNDVIHLSPINPQLILDIWAKKGWIKQRREYLVYKIPASQLKEENAIYLNPIIYPEDDFLFSQDQVAPFCLNTYSELKNIPLQQVELWSKDNEKGRPMFWFSLITHVLYKGNIDVSNVDCFICK
jgi:hypothetical protein